MAIRWQDGKQGEMELVAFPSAKNPKNIRVVRINRSKDGKSEFQGMFLLCGKVSKSGKPFFSVGIIDDAQEEQEEQATGDETGAVNEAPKKRKLEGITL